MINILQMAGKAAQEWAAQEIPSQSGAQAATYLWGRKILVRSADMTFDGAELDIEAEVPFDDDMEPNEAEITIYNLSWDSASRLKNGQGITVEAGYGDDTGVIFSGFISKVSNKWEGADRATVIKALDDVSSKTVESVKFAKGSTASSILKSLLGKTGTPIAAFAPRTDKTYDGEQTVNGDLMENIKKYAEVCGISVYVMKGKIYARPLSDGDNISFTVSEDTGLIGAPEDFEEEQTVGENVTETVRGYEMELLLQHRIQTAAIINLDSRMVNGQFRVKSGSHIINADEFYTKIKVI